MTAQTQVSADASWHQDHLIIVNKDCDYSAAYVVLKTDATTGPTEGHGLTFVIGRGCEVVCLAIEAVCWSVLAPGYVADF